MSATPPLKCSFKLALGHVANWMQHCMHGAWAAVRAVTVADDWARAGWVWGVQNLSNSNFNLSNFNFHNLGEAACQEIDHGSFSRFYLLFFLELLGMKYLMWTLTLFRRICPIDYRVSYSI